jgi:two-component system nitrate/nitrite response regulator NarL
MGQFNLALVDPPAEPSHIAPMIVDLKQVAPNIRIVMLSDRFDRNVMNAVLASGGEGYLLNNLSCEALIKALELIDLGQKLFPSEAFAGYADGPRFDEACRELDGERNGISTLSAREVDILRSLCIGNSNKLIAREFRISEATVKAHVKSILRKLQVRNRTEAAHWAWDRGFDSIRVNSH